MTAEKKRPFDILHFSHLSPPLAPNAHEISIYQELLLKYSKNKPQKSLLLGYTNGLFDLCDKAMDMHFPASILQSHPQKCIQADWFEPFDRSYDVIIGDGVLNLVGGQLVEHLSKVCKTLVIRFFTQKISTMKYATYFRHNTHCLLPHEIIPTQKSCVIYVWHFHESSD